MAQSGPPLNVGIGIAMKNTPLHRNNALRSLVHSYMPDCGLLSPTTPSRLAFLIVVSLAFLSAKPVLSDSSAEKGASAPINADDYFQIPADLFVHGHSLARKSEEIRTYTQLAHRVKTVDGWKTSSEGQVVSIDHKLVSDSFFYHSSSSGAVTNITSVFETVSDTVYFDQLPSVTSVACNADIISIKFNSSELFQSSKSALSFGSKCSHYAPGLRVTGGNAIFCSTPSDSAASIFRHVTAVMSCVEDPASGRASSVKLSTTEANPLPFYSSVSDYSVNGSMVLIPKRLFRPNSKVDFFELSRQLWKERQTGPRLRGACEGVSAEDGACLDDEYGVFTGIRIGGTVQKSAFYLLLHHLFVLHICASFSFYRIILQCQEVKHMAL